MMSGRATITFPANGRTQEVERVMQQTRDARTFRVGDELPAVTKMLSRKD